MLGRRWLRNTRLGSYLATSPLRPHYWKNSYEAAKTLWFAYGHLRSVRTGGSVDRHGHPVPWYTYPAIEYLAQLDLSDKTVFEYGSGNSTLFWAAHARSVVSVEDEEQWSESLRQRVPTNSTVIQEADLKRYVDVIRRFPDGFDIIVVDGPARGHTRLNCARAAIQFLKPGGLIILDNSDWLPLSAQFLRDAGLLQVDMSGFVPIGHHTQTTSFFFHRDNRFGVKGTRQPLPSVGARHLDWEDPTPVEGATLVWDGEEIRGVVRHEVLEKAAARGPRPFEVAFCRHAGVPTLKVFLYDVGTQRVLYGPYSVADAPPAVDGEIARLRAMSWAEFRGFVRNPDWRRYVVDDEVKAADRQVER